MVTVTVPDKVLIEETCLISPEKPWIHEVTINAVEIGDKPITIIVTDSLGRVILENTQNREPSQLDAFDKREAIHPTTADDFYMLGVQHENFDNREQAKEAYMKALLVADNHQKAHLRFGLMLLRSAQFKEADMHLSRAEELGLVESSYYRGLIALFEGRLTDAEENFKFGQASESHSTAAVIGLGKVALRNKKWDQAIGFFYQASQQAAGTVSPATFLAIALRHAGKVEETRAELQRVLTEDPLNHPALYEMASGNYPESVAVQRKLQRILSDDYQYFIDLACYYIDAGLPGDALKVLKTAWSQKENAMTAYLGAFVSNLIGDTRAERDWFEKAWRASPDYGFPSRLQEVLALQFTLEKDSQDAKAKYFLGNFFYAHERFDEAIQLWAGPWMGWTYDVLFRNLGVGAWQRQNNPSEAITWFERALVLDPHNQDLYLHLDELYKSQNLTLQPGTIT